ncbi:MAG TPA: DUF302 domain-containing protein, partial [Thermoleophilia bacterium]|nr:DUF302 domain-containing protein [Thermoleophilia bacterium]
MVFKTVESPYSVDTTMGRLIDALFQRGITVFARIDHASNARLAGLELAEEQVLIFGDPRSGTVLMQADPRSASSCRCAWWSGSGTARRTSATRSPRASAT